MSNPPVCYPVLETAEIKYSVQPGLGFLAPGYFAATAAENNGVGSVHPACDYNDVRGGDSDKGNLVRAITDGVVVSAARYPVWGGNVLIHHPAYRIWTLSAHLDNLRVTAGDLVRMGTPIGQIGKGAWRWAHLHFEIRKTLLPADFWPSARYRSRAQAEAFVRENYLDSEKWLPEHGALRTYREVAALLTAPAARPAPPAYKWAPVIEGGAAVPGLWVSIPVDSAGRLLVKADGVPKIMRVPTARLKEKGLI